MTTQTSEEVLQEQVETADEKPPFSLELNQDQKDIREWVHGFGEGTPEQMGEWIPQCYGTEDDIKVAAFCASEPDAGSDVSAVRTTAKYDEAKDEWVINGQKAWATNGGIADVHVVIASVDRELGSRGHAAFVISKDETEGITQGSKVKKHGL